jgi:hypothetical protein
MKIRFLLLSALFVLNSCDDGEHRIILPEVQLATGWADLTLTTVYKSPPNSPTYTSRSLAYLGLTMYESVVHGSATGQSLAGQLNGLNELPVPESGKEYNWALALNAGQAFMLRALYAHALQETLQQINMFEQENEHHFRETVNNPAVADRSVAFGQSVASAIFEWSKSDGGHEGYLRNFDPEYVFPEGPGYWVPPIGGQSASTFPLHPYWGSNRTFLIQNSELSVPEMLPYSTDPSSLYYKEFSAVYIKGNSLTNEEMNIAAWWADDPTQTSSPPGHSFNLATLAIEKSGSDMFTAAEVYAKVGMAVADSFINCWKCKYTYHAERPFNYIREFIDNDYLQFWPEPPFPAFSSGHATQSAAAAIAMESVFGKNFSLTDDTYAKRTTDFPGIEYESRRYRTLWETAVECAESRFYGGIHTHQDNEAGQNQGKIIGQNISGLEWHE